MVNQRSRMVIWIYLAAFSICGVFGFELWPMTGWRLFADARKQHSASWQPQVEFTDGTSDALQLNTAGSTDIPFLISRLHQLPQNDRNDLCAQLSAIADDNEREGNRALERILIYKSTHNLDDRDGDKSAPPKQELAFTCQDGRLSEPTA